MKLIAFILALFALPAFAAIESGAPAPAFTAQTASGKTISLSDYQGKTVVLEWTNHQCPFVKKFYTNGDMQASQAQAAKDGVVWLRVISSAEGKQGYLTAEEATALATEQKMAAADTILDAQGEMGRSYGAKTTPHMYVINPQGVLAYQGAIDDNASADSADIASATNYVMAALEAVQKGKMPAIAQTTAYGCGVKY